MSILTEQKDIAALREGGGRLARVLGMLIKDATPGMSARALDKKAEEHIRAGGDTPAFLNYTPWGAKRPYPAVLCVSVNDEVVHGIPNESEKVFQNGDVVALDIGLIHQGIYVDMATTVAVGKVDAKGKKLIRATKEALEAGIKAARPGNRVGDIGAAIEAVAQSYGFSVVEELGGHGVGKVLHDEPHVPNFGTKGEGIELAPGMALALEPIFNEGKRGIKLMKDGYTYKTVDGLRSAHVEHTIFITDKDPEVVTVP